MDIHEMYVAFQEHGSAALAIAVILTTIIQISPIKINPWTALAKKLGKAFTGDLSEQIKKLDKKIDDVDERLKKHVEESDKRDLRKQRESILDFASAIAENKRRYTKEQYEQMLHECDEYAMYCKEKKFANAVAEESIALIRQAYACKLRDNSFLQTTGLTCELIK